MLVIRWYVERKVYVGMCSFIYGHEALNAQFKLVGIPCQVALLLSFKVLKMDTFYLRIVHYWWHIQAYSIFSVLEQGSSGKSRLQWKWMNCNSYIDWAVSALWLICVSIPHRNRVSIVSCFILQLFVHL